MKKQLGYVGLGKMGFNMVERLLEKNYEVIAYTRKPEDKDKIKTAGGISADNYRDLIAKLEAPRLVWLMVPYSAVDEVLGEVVSLLESGDIIIDGGNSPYKESQRRAKELEAKGINFIDAGVSGGPAGARTGACIMVGGKKELYERYEELFKDLSAPKAYEYFGDAGAGHFVKMVHNGIEYGMMQAIAEGFDIMKHNKYYDLDLTKVADVYNKKSVVESRLIGWIKSAYEEFGQDLEGISGTAGALGEGAWTIKEAHELGIPDEAIHSALRAREASQIKPSYQGKIISALRNKFGGHPAKEGEDIKIVK